MCSVTKKGCDIFKVYTDAIIKVIKTGFNNVTQKSKFLLSQAFKWKKIMYFVIPVITSKTFVMLSKKLPDHFKFSTYLPFPHLLFDEIFPRCELVFTARLD